jgi:hypothetical protein
MSFVSDELPYGTSMPGAGAVHHINFGLATTRDGGNTSRDAKRHHNAKRYRLRMQLPAFGGTELIRNLLAEGAA